jgi:Tfp pilus assembly protein PilO
MKTPDILKKIPRLQLILFPVIIVLIVVNVFVVMGYLSTLSTKADLEKNIEQKEAAIASMEGRYNIGELQRQLAEAERKLAEDAPFPDEIDNKEIIELLIRTQKESGLDVPYIETADSTTTIGGNTYSAKIQPISICEVGQPLSKLIDFLEILEDEQYNTLKNDNIELIGPEAWTLNFNIIIVYQ